MLDEWEINLVLVNSGNPLVGALDQAGWEPLYTDEFEYLYGREE